MANNLSVQCLMAKGDTKQVAWIPIVYARIGRLVKLKQEDGSWDDGWKVLEVNLVSATDGEFIRQRGQDYKKMKEVTDI